jgi:hypothetical protein
MNLFSSWFTNGFSITWLIKQSINQSTTRASFGPKIMFLKNLIFHLCQNFKIVHNPFARILKTAYPSPAQWFTHRGLHVAHLISFLCFLFVLFVFVLCLVYPMLPVSLDYPFLIVPSVFSNVDLFCLSSSCVLCTWR